MPTITITLTDTEMAILRTHLTDPESWINDAVANKIRRCADRVYEETTGRVARKIKPADKLAELADYALPVRKDGDMRMKLKGEKKQ